MMLIYQLVRLIESHSEQLAGGLLEKLLTSDKTPGYRHIVPCEEVAREAAAIYHHLGEWLMGKTEAELASHYLEIGRRRYLQRVCLPELIWALVLTQEHLWEFLKQESRPESPIEFSSEMEVLVLLEQFFSRAIYYAVAGYEQASCAQELQDVPV